MHLEVVEDLEHQAFLAAVEVLEYLAYLEAVEDLEFLEHLVEEVEPPGLLVVAEVQNLELRAVVEVEADHQKQAFLAFLAVVVELEDLEVNLVLLVVEAEEVLQNRELQEVEAVVEVLHQNHLVVAVEEELEVQAEREVHL